MKADVTGFLRRGVNWCDVVPFRDHSLEVTASRDGLTCLLSFVPGDAAAPPPDAAGRPVPCAAAGFRRGVAPARARDRVDDAGRGARAQPRWRPPLSHPVVNGVALVTVSADKLKAVLFLRKGRGGGTPLAPAAVSEAIRASKVKGFDPDTVRKDLLAFFAGTATELADYLLVSGRAAEAGPRAEDRMAGHVPPCGRGGRDQGGRQRPTRSACRPSRPSPLFPLASVEAVARVKKDAEVLRITPSGRRAGGGRVRRCDQPRRKRVRRRAPVRRPGDAQGHRRGHRAGHTGKGQRRDGHPPAGPAAPGRGDAGDPVAGPHEGASSPSSRPRETARGSRPRRCARGWGRRGCRRGSTSRSCSLVLDKRRAAASGFTDHQIAEGARPGWTRRSGSSSTSSIAIGQGRVARARTGRADFRAQDRITRVQKGELIATVRPRDPPTEDGWDVTGQVLTPAARGAGDAAGGPRGARGSCSRTGASVSPPRRAGELVRDGGVLSVTEAHTRRRRRRPWPRATSSSPGIVRIGGSVRSGFTVVAEGVLEIGAAVEAALLSARRDHHRRRRGSRERARRSCGRRRDIESHVRRAGGPPGHRRRAPARPLRPLPGEVQRHAAARFGKGHPRGRRGARQPRRGGAEHRLPGRRAHHRLLRPGLPGEGPDRAGGAGGRGAHEEGGRPGRGDVRPGEARRGSTGAARGRRSRAVPGSGARWRAPGRRRSRP